MTDEQVDRIVTSIDNMDKSISRSVFGIVLILVAICFQIALK